MVKPYSNEIEKLLRRTELDLEETSSTSEGLLRMQRLQVFAALKGVSLKSVLSQVFESPSIDIDKLFDC